MIETGELGASDRGYDRANRGTEGSQEAMSTDAFRRLLVDDSRPTSGLNRIGSRIVSTTISYTSNASL